MTESIWVCETPLMSPRERRASFHTAANLCVSWLQADEAGRTCMPFDCRRQHDGCPTASLVGRYTQASRLRIWLAATSPFVLRISKTVTTASRAVMPGLARRARSGKGRSRSVKTSSADTNQSNCAHTDIDSVHAGERDICTRQSRETDRVVHGNG